MIIFQHSAFNAQSIGAHLGAPEYSYWFVRNAFRPVLERLGIVVPINESASEVDRYFRNAAAHDQPGVHPGIKKEDSRMNAHSLPAGVRITEGAGSLGYSLQLTRENMAPWGSRP